MCEELEQDLCEGTAACVWGDDGCTTREASCADFTDQGSCERAKCGWVGTCVDNCCVDVGLGCVTACGRGVSPEFCSCSAGNCASCCGQCRTDDDCADGYECTAANGCPLPACDGSSDCTGSCVLENESLLCAGCLSDDDCEAGEVCDEPDSSEDSCECLAEGKPDICAGSCRADTTTTGDVPGPDECCLDETTGTCVSTCVDLIIDCFCSEAVCEICAGTS